MEARVPAGLTTKQGREFGLLVGGAFVLIAAIFWWRGKLGVVPYVGGLGGVLILGGVVAPRSLGPLYRAWMGLALLISKVTTPIFMGVIYFVVITPIGIVMRLAGRRALVHRPKNDSYWFDRDPVPPAPASMKRQF